MGTFMESGSPDVKYCILGGAIWTKPLFPIKAMMANPSLGAAATAESSTAAKDSRMSINLGIPRLL